MSSGDLFSFVNNDNDSENSDSDTTSDAMLVDSVPRTELARASTPSNKTKRSATSSELQTIKSPPPSPPSENEPPFKKKRFDAPSTSAPAVLVDEFETEAKREVAASAGLTGATETAGSRLELRHQARLQETFLKLLADCQL